MTRLVSIQVRSLASRDAVILGFLFLHHSVSIQVRSLASRDLYYLLTIKIPTVSSFHSGEIPSE